MQGLRRRNGHQQQAGIRRIGGGLALTNCSMPTAIGPGGSFQPTVTVDNNTGSSTTLSVTWSAGGSPIASATWTVPQGVSTRTGPTVTYDALLNDFGTDTLAVDAISDAGHVATCGNLTISSTGGSGEPNIGVNSCRASRNTIGPGEATVFEAEVVNNGDGQGTTTLTWQADNTAIRERSVTVSPGEIQQVQTADVTHSDLHELFGAQTVDIVLAGPRMTDCTPLTIEPADGNGGGVPGNGDGGGGISFGNLGIEHAVLGLGALSVGFVAWQELQGGGGRRRSGRQRAGRQTQQTASRAGSGGR